MVRWRYIIILLALLLAGCASIQDPMGSGMTYQSPYGWQVWDESQLQAASLVTPGTTWESIAAARGVPLKDVFTPSASPWLLTVVIPLDTKERIALSFNSMAEIVTGFPGLSKAQPMSESLLQKGVWRGLQIQWSANGETVDTISWANAATTTLALMIVGCSTNCVESNSTVINQLLTTFVPINPKEN